MHARARGGGHEWLTEGEIRNGRGRRRCGIPASTFALTRCSTTFKCMIASCASPKLSRILEARGGLEDWHRGTGAVTGAGGVLGKEGMKMSNKELHPVEHEFLPEEREFLKVSRCDWLALGRACLTVCQLPVLRVRERDV